MIHLRNKYKNWKKRNKKTEEPLQICSNIKELFEKTCTDRVLSFIYLVRYKFTRKKQKERFNSKATVTKKIENKRHVPEKF